MIRAQAVRFENSKTILNADSATAMGEYYFTTLEGTVAKVEYTSHSVHNQISRHC